MKSKGRQLTVMVKRAKICLPGLAALVMESDPDNDGTFCIYARIHFDREVEDLLGLQVVKHVRNKEWEVIT